MMPMILTVYLSDGEQALTEVPITPETTCRDVVEFCKEPGESGCHLAEVWRGNERPIPFDHMMYEHLQKWGPRKQEVKFYLRHEDSPTESSDQGSQQSQEQPSRRGGSSSDMHNENGVGNPRVELTLSELQEMATRQQQQIEAQQQMLVAKEQRLRYLKQQERRQQQAVSETEKLQRLKERVESQEAKLKKIRAMRGQVDYSKVINGNLSAEIEHISGLFQEKQAELQSAVSRVDQLSQQLEDLRRGKLNGLQTLGGQVTGNAALELRKLYQELQIRNKLNQEQNSKLQQQKELLNKRNMEVTLMDKRINELRDRLYKRKAEARQKENLPLNRVNGPPSPQPAHGNTGRVAAVGPYIQVPVPGRQEGYVVPPEPLKPQSLGVNTPANHARSKSDGVRKPPGPWKVSDLDIIVDPIAPPPPEPRPGPGAPPPVTCSAAGSNSASPNDAGWPTLNKSNTSVKPPDWKESGTDTSSKTASPAGTPADKIQDSSKMGPGPPLNKPQPPPYGAHASNHPLSSANSGSTSSLDRRKDVPLRPVPSLPNNPPPLPAWPRVPPTPSGSSSQQIQQRISVPPSPTFQPSPPFFPPGERPDPPLAVAVRPFIPDKGSRPQSPRKGPATMNSSSIYHMYLQQAAPKNYPLNIKPAVKAVYGKPVLPPSSTPPSPLLFGGSGAFPALQGPGGDMLDLELDFDGQILGVPEPPPPSVDHIPRPLSPTKLTPMVHSPMRYQSDAELEVLRKKLANAPRPLKKRSSITEPEGPNGPNIQKLLYQRFNTLAGGMEGGMGGVSGGGGVTPFYQPSVATGEMLFDADNGNPPSETPATPSEGAVVEDVVLQGDANDNEPLEQAVEPLTPPAPEPSEDSNNNPAEPVVVLPSPVAEASTPEEADTSPSSQPTGKRTNLKKPDSERTGHGLRVKFNPLALLLDASLEGEFDLVQRIIYEVVNPSTPNDEGITPLHNSVCAGHHHIVKFLLDFGVNVNAADSDGWTPLHCAASCNSVHLCKLLVESGAAIFATTISDVETAADKCEEMEEGFIQCSQFLYGVQEKLGVMNKGVVYALWEYEAQSADELSFQEGDAITVLRRKDDTETDWWWSKLNDKEGYVPRNLLGLYPRIKPRQRSLA
ncbi:protein phosphatase 1, regulatory subunit 13Bb isoform X3 [Rhinichthys klamathensis goyatoka]|uniref:protein phosphatase 1, regulatory subunit 13Bb isoform X3 n=1 Tax=Rhinichthys klamathensis goyatoka TaxID=3034132 RepID=UPI0024B5B74D|nr:protein phosphatase 1, regulatory subunit 13Bb isoform X3 [Rhinichthys klamathensis goyatoka]